VDRVREFPDPETSDDEIGGRFHIRWPFNESGSGLRGSFRQPKGEIKNHPTGQPVWNLT
jgi:hypothetical protein